MAEEQVVIAVGEVKYLLVPNHKVVLTTTPILLFTTCVPPPDKRTARQKLGIEHTILDDHSPSLVLVYNTAAGQTISESTLRNFHAGVLDCDDVFRPEFYRNVLFYGVKKEVLNFEPDAIEYLASWGTESTFVASGIELAPGPYVVKDGRAWQPWRIYHDFNSTFMTTFKPSGDGSSGLGQSFYTKDLRTILIE